MNKFLALIRFLFNKRSLYPLAWVLVLALATGRIINAYYCFEDSTRVDGNNGHYSIDFGGQWLMGRMLASGYGTELYSRPRLWQVAAQAYPSEFDSPTVCAAKELLNDLRGKDDPRWNNIRMAVVALVGAPDPYQQTAVAIAGEPEWSEQRLNELTHPTGKPGIGGALYPPINAFMMCPFALDDHPQTAYFTMQWVQMLFCFVAGLGVSRLSRGKFWWPLATALILIYPGCRGAIDLGQNSCLSLALLVWGWVALARGRPVLGGVCWGFLAYKPVWALSFFLLLLLIRQWRAPLAMATTGAALILATLPFVGLHSWFHWLAIGQDAAALYNVDGNWVPLSRDLLGIPRRLLLDFTYPTSMPPKERDTVLAMAASWALWALVVEITLRVYSLHGRRPIPFIGPLPALLILATWMCTFHFMYYDSLLSAFGICVLLADPLPFFRMRTIDGAEADFSKRAGPDRNGPRSVWLVNSFVLTLLVFMLIHESVTLLMKIEVTGVGMQIEVDGIANAITIARTYQDGTTEVSPRFVGGTSHMYAVETFMLIALWAWCGLTVLAGRFARPEDGEYPQSVKQ